VNATLERRLATAAGQMPAVTTDLPADPVAFAIAAGVTPDLWQAEVLRSPARNTILCCARQTGKSTVTAVMASHQAATVPGSLVPLFSPTLYQSEELYEQIRAVLAGLGSEAPRLVEESAREFRMANGSRVVCRPAKEANVRGLSSAALLVVDEAARVLDALYRTIRPMILVSRGRVMLLSTPWGQRGFFWDEWDKAGPEWHRVMVTAAECPRIDPAELAYERSRVPEWWARQEDDCAFVDAEDQLYPSDLIDAAFKPGLETWDL
jgi:hypothetical protein